MPNCKMGKDSGSKPASFIFGSVPCCGSALPFIDCLVSPSKALLFCHIYNYCLSTMSSKA